MHFRLFSLTTCNIYLSMYLEVDINLSVVIEQCRIHAQCSTSIVNFMFLINELVCLFHSIIIILSTID